MTEGKPLRWGLIGTGGIASAFAGDLARTSSGVPFAVGSRSKRRPKRSPTASIFRAGTPLTRH